MVKCYNLYLSCTWLHYQTHCILQTSQQQSFMTFTMYALQQIFQLFYNVYKHLENFNIHTIHEPSMLTTLIYVTFDTKHIQALAITILSSVYKLQNSYSVEHHKFDVHNNFIFGMVRILLQFHKFTWHSKAITTSLKLTQLQTMKIKVCCVHFLQNSQHE